MARPGMLDMLGRAKWDSWNKQKGSEKGDAKIRYVSALIKVSALLGDDCGLIIDPQEVFTE
jgi:acyl-CoA-binding protein